MNLDLDILIVLEVLRYIVNLTQFIKCNEDTYLPLAVYWGCEQLHFPEVHFTQNFPHYFSHLPAIPDISIIFCRRGSVGAGVPRGFYQLIKVLRKETGQAIRGPVGAQQQLHSSTGQSFHFWIWIEGSIQSLDGWPHPLFCRCPAKKVRWAECREKAASRACLSVSVLAEEKIRFSRMSSCSREGGSAVQ